MYANDLARTIAHWTREHQFCGEVSVHRRDDSYVVAFEARTTKTRASSMVTRLKLIVDELVHGMPVSVGKDLVSVAPRSRDDLASWKIFVIVPVRRRSHTRVITPVVFA